MFGKPLRAAGAVTALLTLLAACDSHPHPVHGLRDTLRHVPARTIRATRPHMVKQCTTSTSRVGHSSTSGSGTHRHTRHWYTLERRQNCHKVPNGTETYRKELSPERWCVRLDDVNGNRKKDDVWYRVTRTDYNRVLDADDDRVQFEPLFPNNGCWGR
ncbi:hypothetical protein [Streptomyces sp. NPDC046759]|uniref:hypothetical protein n=1 Tax=Streptomyces sp. NPDC046759 TaxID=3155019 RepID=UPI0034093882